jgi:hypothetical protein
MGFDSSLSLFNAARQLFRIGIALPRIIHEHNQISDHPRHETQLD